MSRTLLLVLAGLYSLAQQSLVAQGSIPVNRIETHIEYLASDDLEGRRAAERGSFLAAGYIAGAFAQFGLDRTGDSWFHYFDLPVNLEVSPTSSLRFMPKATPGGDILSGSGDPLQINAEWAPLGFSENASVSAPLVFAGYAISAPDADYDDFAGVDVEGKIVVAFRGSPQFSNPHSPLRAHAPFQQKFRAVREHGGIGLILVDLSDRSAGGLIPTGISRAVGSAGIPVVSITPGVLERIMPVGKKDIYSIADRIDSLLIPESFGLNDIEAAVSVDLEVIYESVPNVLGLLPGNDPSKADEIVVIGGHYDHLGFGGIGSLHDKFGEVHNGADDNASGVAAILALAEHFSEVGSARSILFTAFNAEELGLLGSAALVEDPPFDLENVVAMINLDMVGRLSENGLTVGGTGTSPVWTDLLAKAIPDGQEVSYTEPGMGPSDHTSFYLKDVPVLFFFTGLHSDYHRPGDDPHLVDKEGVRQIASYVANLVDGMEALPDESIAFTATKSPRRSASAFSVYFGIVPDYGFGGDGLRISGVSDGGPAESGGLKGGDVIVRMGEWEVEDIYDLTEILGKLSPGDEVPVRYLREGDEMMSVVKMEAR